MPCFEGQGSSSAFKAGHSEARLGIMTEAEPRVLGVDEISSLLLGAGLNYLPTYSSLYGEQGKGTPELRNVAYAVRTEHGGIYRTAAMMWLNFGESWQHFPVDPIPRKIVSIDDGEVKFAPSRVFPERGATSPMGHFRRCFGQPMKARRMTSRPSVKSSLTQSRSGMGFTRGRGGPGGD